MESHRPEFFLHEVNTSGTNVMGQLRLPSRGGAAAAAAAWPRRNRFNARPIEKIWRISLFVTDDAVAKLYVM